MQDIRILPDSQAIARAAADIILATASSNFAAKRPSSLVLSGGSTPKLLYQILAADPYRSQIHWPTVELFFGDERAVPPDHPDSNFKMANESLISKVPLDPKNIHRMRGEQDPTQAASEYARLLVARFKDSTGPDITLLGMGDDGHTASLFPHTPALNETTRPAVAHYVEKSTTGKSWRITLTAPFINRSNQVLALITGASKAPALKEVLEGPADPQRLPLQLIHPTPGKMIWFLDPPAAQQLTTDN